MLLFALEFHLRVYYDPLCRRVRFQEAKNLVAVVPVASSTTQWFARSADWKNEYRNGANYLLGTELERNSFTLAGLHRIVLFRQFEREVSLCSASLFDRRTRPSVEVVVVSIGLLRGIGYVERSRATSSDNFNEKQINKSKELVLPAFWARLSAHTKDLCYFLSRQLEFSFVSKPSFCPLFFVLS